MPKLSQTSLLKTYRTASEQKHAICFVKQDGEVLRNLQIPHNTNGFVTLNKSRQEPGIAANECVIGLETAHNLLVDYLWEVGYQQIYIIPPRAVKSAQGRFRQSGAKDDPWDARLIADILRTDLNRFSLWHLDSPITRQMRSAVRMILHLTKESVRNKNRLRAVLLRYYPAALNMFTHLDSPVLLSFIQAFSDPITASKLDFEEFCSFMRSHHHNRPQGWVHSFNKLKEPYPPTHPDIIATYAPQALRLASILLLLVKEKEHWQKTLTNLYLSHPDHEIYSSLPAAGFFLEPTLLAKLGDDRQCIPSPKILQAVAGTCPATRHSGKRQAVFFRWACDHEFNYIVHQWAKLSREISLWAEAYYRTVLPPRKSPNDAIRRLSNRWLEILWRVWQDHKP